MTFQVIAHRGNSSEAPENTLAAFESAIACGATVVECDVQMTKDGHLVVIHDPTLDRTTDRRGDVRDLSLLEVQAADASYRAVFGSAFAPQRVPTLGELLAFLNGRARLMIEIKKESSRDENDEFERRIAEVIMASGVRVSAEMETDAAVISFSTRVLERMARLLPGVLRGHLFYREPAGTMFAAAERTNARFVMPEKGCVTKELVENAAAHGLGVATWVCDDPDEFIRLKPLGLIGAGSNRPRELLRAVSADSSKNAAPLDHE